MALYLVVGVLAGITLHAILRHALSGRRAAVRAGGPDDAERRAARLHALLDHAPSAGFLLEPNTRSTVLANGPAADLFGIDVGDLMGVDPLEFSPDEQSDGAASSQRATALVQAALGGESVEASWTIRGASGRLIPCHLRMALVPHPEDAGSLLRLGILDMSEREAEADRRRGLEARLRRAEKLETIGGLAGGIAHEFNNLLLPIVAYSEILREELEPGKNRDYAARIERSARQAGDLVHKMLAFSRQSEQDRSVEALPIQAALKETSELLASLLPASVKIERIFDATGVLVEFDPSELRQLLMNLGQNAADAMPEGGTLSISLGVVETPEGWAEGDTAPAAEVVLLAISDTGVGMDEEMQQRIFDPFFSTREVGAGAGLGLSVVHGITSSWGGVVDVQSAPGGGTTFRIYLPISGRVGGRFGDTEGTTRGVADGEPERRVLLVDDRDDVLEATATTLRRIGYEVAAFSSVYDALEYAGSHRVDVGLIDYDMPDMNGVELTRALREIHPRLPVALLSGGNWSVDSEDVGEGPWATMLKPALRDQLSEVLTDLLTRAAVD